MPPRAAGGDKGKRKAQENNTVKEFGKKRQTPKEFTHGEIKKMTNDYSEQINKDEGKGSFGKIFKGETEKGCRVAVKRYEAEHSHQYIKEKKTYMVVNHPNILTLYGFDDGKLELVLEYVPMDLDKLINDCDEDLDARRIVNIGKQIASAVKHLNEKNTILCDLSADNILIDKHDHVKICDFGGVTQPGIALNVYSQYYSSPEICSGDKAMPTSDIYSLGVLLLQMVTRVTKGDIGFVPKSTDEWTFQLIHLGIMTARKNQRIDKIESPHITAKAEDKKFMQSFLKQKNIKKDEQMYTLLIELAKECTKINPKGRPNIDEVIQRLNDIDGAGTSKRGL